MDGGFRNIRKGVEPRLRGTGFLGGEQAQLAFGRSATPRSGARPRTEGGVRFRARRRMSAWRGLPTLLAMTPASWTPIREA